MDRNRFFLILPSVWTTRWREIHCPRWNLNWFTWKNSEQKLKFSHFVLNGDNSLERNPLSKMKLKLIYMEKLWTEFFSSPFFALNVDNSLERNPLSKMKPILIYMEKQWTENEILSFCPQCGHLIGEKSTLQDKT